MNIEKIIKGLESHKNKGIGCLECPYSDEEGGTDDWCIHGLHNDILALLKEQEIRWIPVTEKLPELNQRVLVYAVGKIDGFIGEHVTEICSRFVQRILPSSPGYETWSSPYQYFHTDYEITHWMPLPEPPKENDNEE